MTAAYEADRLRQKLRHLWDVYEAIYILINASTKSIRLGFEQSKDNIEKIEVDLLPDLIVQLSKEVDGLKKKYGVITEDQLIVKIASMVEHLGRSGIAIIPKYIIEQLFSNYSAALKKFDKLSPHVRIGIDPGFFRTTQGTAELYLAEATLFEDMCALNNLIVDVPDTSTKVEKKRRDALVRSLIDACFRFIEAFLNGLAFDCNVREYERISEKDREVLTEWDNKRARTKYISLRDKILKYPKIVGRYSIPPLTEDNCAPLKHLLEKSKIFRDAITHASPFLEPGALVPEKDRAFYSVSVKDAMETLDAVIDLVEAIQAALGRPVEDLWWFHRKDGLGRFPDKVFE